jgi:hypothetical protein
MLFYLQGKRYLKSIPIDNNTKKKQFYYSSRSMEDLTSNPTEDS